MQGNPIWHANIHFVTGSYSLREGGDKEKFFLETSNQQMEVMKEITKKVKKFHSPDYNYKAHCRKIA